MGRPCVVRLGEEGIPCKGTVAFRGETQFKHGTWVGVALHEPRGKHDGAVQGIRYFQCAPRHGVFVRESAVVVGADPELLTGPPERMLARTPTSRPRSGSNSDPGAIMVPHGKDNGGSHSGRRSTSTPSRSPRNDSPRRAAGGFGSSRALRSTAARSRSPSPEQLQIDYDSDSDGGVGKTENRGGRSGRAQSKTDHQRQQLQQPPPPKSGGRGRSLSPFTVEALKSRDARQIIDEVYSKVDSGRMGGHRHQEGGQSIAGRNGREDEDKDKDDDDENYDDEDQDADEGSEAGSDGNLGSGAEGIDGSGEVQPTTLKQAEVLKKVCACILRNPRQVREYCACAVVSLVASSVAQGSR